MEQLRKQIFKKIKTCMSKILGVLFPRIKTDSLADILDKKEVFAVFDLYIIEMANELFKERGANTIYWCFRK